MTKITFTEASTLKPSHYNPGPPGSYRHQQGLLYPAEEF
jgi:hypothetical protein